MAPLRRKSLALTAYLEALLTLELPKVRVITPKDPASRGAQLSIELPEGVTLSAVKARINADGVIIDTREPNVMRVAPAPLYNSFHDVWDFVSILRRAIEAEA